MNTTKSELIAKFRSGVLTVEEQHQLELMIEKGEIFLHELEELDQLQDQLMALESPVPSLEVDNKFYAMLADQKKSARSARWWQQLKFPELMPRLGLAVGMLLIGIVAGYLIRPNTSNDGDQISKLSDEVTSLKEMMMFSLLEKESASDRLKAVSLTQEMDQASQKVTAALIQTLNNDDNVNVRLAALDALQPYVKDSSIRQELIQSIALQRSPLVQVALAELMVAIQEKSSVSELKKLLKDKKTPHDVKKKIEESIDVLI